MNEEPTDGQTPEGDDEQHPSPWGATPVDPVDDAPVDPVDDHDEMRPVPEQPPGDPTLQQPPAPGQWGQTPPPAPPAPPAPGQWGQTPQPPAPPAPGQWGQPPPPAPGQWGRPPAGQQPQPPGWQGGGAGPQGPGGLPPGAYGVGMPIYPSQPGKRKGRGKAFAGVAVGTVLALAAAAFAVTSFGDAAPSSPEAAVEALFAAVEQRDVLGVLDTLAPGERELYQPFIEDVVAELSRLEVLSEDIDLGSVKGFEFDVEGLELESEELGEGVSVVRITGGTITSSVNPEEVPVGAFVRDLMDDPQNDVDMGIVSETSDLANDVPVEIVVIDDEGWHVSMYYSIAEAARKDARAPIPDFGNGVQPEGAASPEAAVRELVEASANLDVRRVISLLPPGEMSALHDYAPLFLDDFEEFAEELRTWTNFEISVDELDTEVDEDGDVAKVSVSGFTASGTVTGEPFDVAYDGECFSGTFEGESDEFCFDDYEQTVLGGDFAKRMADASLTVLTVQEGGEWFVTPTRTFMEYALVVLRALDPEDLEDPEALLREAFAFDSFQFGAGGVDESFTAGDLDEVDPFEECSPIFDALPPGATPEQTAEADKAYSDCYDGVLGVEPVPGDECFDIYLDLPSDATDEQYAEADAAYRVCYDAAVPG